MDIPQDLPPGMAALMTRLVVARPAQFRLWERAVAEDATLKPLRDTYSQMALGLYVVLPRLVGPDLPILKEVEWIPLLAQMVHVELQDFARMVEIARIWRAIAPHLAAEPEAFPGLAVLPSPLDEGV